MDKGDLAPSKPTSVGIELERNLKEIQRFEKFLTHQGISNLDGINSPAIKRVNEAIQQLVNESKSSLPEIYKYVVAELVVSHILIARAAMTTIIATARPTVSNTEIGAAKRRAYKDATDSFNRSTRAIYDGLARLGVDTANTGGNSPSLSDLLKEMKAKKVDVVPEEGHTN